MSACKQTEHNSNIVEVKLEAQWAELVSLTFHSVLRKLYRTFHWCFLQNFGSFGYSVSEEKIFLEIDQSVSNNCACHVCFTDRDEMSNP